ncbi:GNAT family N-acetyltransferase [Chryseobacterium sp. T16E-39]|uniref:GNAT family N-acetyltransferase n=1 Tax=Chryseobacterium sp. T16E-39 TaxID=2015076 RepID=UPI000B5B24CD|nr:GNAT family N-acetyltransferase [Chryseobacterium sp. T16E-39]ASK32665.1 GNAT family N-acetyltransferase [Chryseobacterium sp. T16E-39]
MSSIIVNKAFLEDMETIQEIGKETFSETFSGSNSKEEMDLYLEESFNKNRLTRELSNPESFFFIAWEEDHPIGYLKLNSGSAQTELQDEISLEIERIYVKSSHYGKKVGQLLYDKALEIAKEKKKTYIWLGVWEENPRAINFYKKNGFIEFDKHIFRLGNEEQTDLMMKKILE